MSVNLSNLMGEYDPALRCVYVSNILMHSDTGAQSKEVMKCAGFKQVDIKYDTYRKRIETLKNKIVVSKSSQIVVRDSSIVASHPYQIVVRDGSTSSSSILKIGYGETAIVGAPPSQVLNLVTPITAMTKVSSIDIETTRTIPRDTIRHKSVVVYSRIMQRSVI